MVLHCRHFACIVQGKHTDYFDKNDNLTEVILCKYGLIKANKAYVVGSCWLLVSTTHLRFHPPYFSCFIYDGSLEKHINQNYYSSNYLLII